MSTEVLVRVRAADLVALSKPRIMMMTLVTAAGGLSLAPGTPDLWLWLVLMVGTGLMVGAANTLNMYLERDIDCLMARTRERPLPQRRMPPEVALGFGVAQAALAVPLLTFGIGGVAGPLTGLLGVIALLSYVMVYTPLKQRTWIATWIGAVPGAMPALMGWTAATGRIELGGVAVFALLLIWQIPHFHAIALFRWKEYARAGLKTLPGVRGDAAATREIVVYSLVQVAVSLTPWALGVAGLVYLGVAAVAGAVFLGAVLTGRGPRWGKRIFLLSIVYLPVVFTALVLDGSR